MRYVIFFALMLIVPTTFCILSVQKIKERIAKRNAPQFSMIDLMLLPLCLLPSIGAAILAAQEKGNWGKWILVGFCFYYQLSFALASWSSFSWGMGTSGPNNFMAAFIGAWTGLFFGLAIFLLAAVLSNL